MALLALALTVAGCDGESSDTGSGGAGGEGATTTSSDTGPKCTGTPKPCIERSSFDCIVPAGCSDGGACTGGGSLCDEHTDEQACAQQLGCVWTPQPAKCTGPGACAGNESKTDCEQDDEGCTWDPGGAAYCGGYATSCSGFMTIDLCISDDECTWEGGACGGYAEPCYKFTTESGCYVQTGCEWK